MVTSEEYNEIRQYYEFSQSLADDMKLCIESNKNKIKDYEIALKSKGMSSNPEIARLKKECLDILKQLEELEKQEMPSKYPYPESTEQPSGYPYPNKAFSKSKAFYPFE